MNMWETRFLSLHGMTGEIRNIGLALLTKADMDFVLGDNLPSAADLGRVLGDVQCAYTSSFSTRVMDFAIEAPGRDAAGKDGAAMADWFNKLDDEMTAVLKALTDKELETETVNRVGEWAVPLITQFHIFREAQLIFLGRLDMYLRGLDKPRPSRWVEWLG